ncbi:hypothetical protein DPEC_G00349750 [Dallia pectoralis]|uniref:Uncharacterized protein n=1 Tax=Dallia pectoralis TaxID=75939 RepID=A0ACC2F1H5_DALPE|nr:hypothetical protein DPEC_G00349750 [Dallia pectoralis]
MALQLDNLLASRGHPDAARPAGLCGRSLIQDLLSQSLTITMTPGTVKAVGTVWWLLREGPGVAPRSRMGSRFLCFGTMGELV